MTLTSHQKAALRYIAACGGAEIGNLPLGTIKALERRGLVQTHSSGRFIGALGHFLTEEGARVATRIKRGA
jgi:hypothetical protein